MADCIRASTYPHQHRVTNFSNLGPLLYQKIQHPPVITPEVAYQLLAVGGNWSGHVHISMELIFHLSMVFHVEVHGYN